jgi:hypothetical protein
MWIDWYRKYQPVEPEYEDCWRVSEANESQTSYSVEQADIFHIQMTCLSSLNQTQKIQLVWYFTVWTDEEELNTDD